MMKMLFALIMLSCTSLRADILTDVLRATARVSSISTNQNGQRVMAYGTGTVFLLANLDGNGERYHILTNGHVIESNDITTQFFRDGYESPKFRARLDYRNYQPGTDVDLSVISVGKTQIGGYQPGVIPLAPRDYDLKDGQILFGGSCPQAQPAMAWESRVLKNLGRTVRFKHAPIGGQSGTGVISIIDDKPYISILLAWRVNDGEYGLGMSSKQIWSILDKKVTPKTIETAYEVGHVEDSLKKVCSHCGVALGQHRFLPDGRGGVEITNGGWLHCPTVDMVNNKNSIRVDKFIQSSGALGQSLEMEYG